MINVRCDVTNCDEEANTLLFESFDLSLCKVHESDLHTFGLDHIVARETALLRANDE